MPNLDHAHAEALAENAMRRDGMTPEDAYHIAMELWGPMATQDMLDDWMHYRDEFDRRICASMGIHPGPIGRPRRWERRKTRP